MKSLLITAITLMGWLFAKAQVGHTENLEQNTPKAVCVTSMCKGASAKHCRNIDLNLTGHLRLEPNHLKTISHEHE